MSHAIKILSKIDGLLYEDTIKGNMFMPYKEMIDIKHVNASKIPKNKRFVGLMDASNTCMVVPMNEESYNILFTIFCNQSDGWWKMPDLNYDGQGGRSKFSVEYLKKILPIVDEMSDIVTIYCRENYPLTIEVQDEDYHFRIILAPRVDNEKE